LLYLGQGVDFLGLDQALEVGHTEIMILDHLLDEVVQPTIHKLINMWGYHLKLTNNILFNWISGLENIAFLLLLIILLFSDKLPLKIRIGNQTRLGIREKSMTMLHQKLYPLFPFK